MNSAPLPPGSTIGIIGGGQLARMLAMAAARLGYRTIVLDPDPACPAAQLANETLVAAYDDVAALGRLVGRCDIVTYEFENVPVEPLRVAVQAVPLHPSADALEIAQDRVVEKAFLNGIGVATAEWRAIDSVAELNHAMIELGGEAILKTRRFGYDGKGQATIRKDAPLANVFESLGGVPSILERRIPFAYECSVIGARGTDGTIAVFDPAENVHGLGILQRSTVPGQITEDVAREAKGIASRILQRLQYAGVIGVEFFVGADGGLLVNEIAPRVHNSGHWTEAACVISQFEQHIRAVAGLPLGAPARHSDCVMENLIGDDVKRAASLLTEPAVLVHLYGKAEARAGRKMGHFTRLTGPANV